MSLSDLSPEQRELAKLISWISERRYRAGSRMNIEMEVWRALHVPDAGGPPAAQVNNSNGGRGQCMSSHSRERKLRDTA
ncbi:hypothetical protein ACQ86G_29040 [Roseateles chitinivorans]|uniref:hypothetical protein n=1 Tax=Roseateles chitinivorans TaxID=2917965 RepID=UPI003D67CA84